VSAAAPGDVSRETSARLAALAALVRKWSPAINLVSARDLGQLEARHVADSAQLFDLAPGAARRWIDLGSGGGFPGLVIAALAAARRPGLRVTLVESDARKCAFLATAAAALELDVAIENRRIEAGPPAAFDVVSARALAPLPALFGLAAPYFGPGTVGLFPKGVGHDAELTAARADWQYAVERIPSATAPSAAILRVTELRPCRS
jgi:16S rRNA (guanine527-N7)-methyltransferase